MRNTKLLVAISICAMALALSACGNGANNTQEVQTTEAKKEVNNTADAAKKEETKTTNVTETQKAVVKEELKGGVVEKGNILEVTIPKEIADATSYTDKTENEIKEDAISKGYKYNEVKKNANGSVMVVLEKAEKDKVLLAFKNDFVKGVEELRGIAGGSIFPHIVSMTASDDFTTCEVITTKEDKEVNDESLASFFFMCGAEYHTFNNNTYKELKVVFKNQDTNAVVNTITSTEYWNKQRGAK